MLSATTATTTASTASAVGAAKNTEATDTAAQDRFMTLLVAQLKNQDPMNPMDNAQMTSQMAQINTVTGIEKVNSTLKSMASQFTAMQVLQASSMVGQSVMVEGNALARRDGVAGGAVELTSKADSVKIDILSPGGQVLETLDMGALDAGRHHFEWNASGYTGSGDPSFRVAATLAGKPVASTSLARDTVVSVGTENGAMSVQLQGRGPIAYDQIKAIL